jgi:hypothetical protein
MPLFDGNFHSPHMTRCAFFFKRTGFKCLVTAGTLLVKGVGSFGNFLIAFIRIVAFTARLGISVLIFSQRVMTVTARQTITGDRMMLFVIKYNVPRRDFKF